jgi:hypothetical protein
MKEPCSTLMQSIAPFVKAMLKNERTGKEE